MAEYEEHRSGRNKENLAGILFSERLATGHSSRSCHIDFTFTKVGGGGKAVDYLAREEDYKDRNDDLEHLAGDPDAVKDAARSVDEAARVRRGPTRERVLSKIIFELPADMNSEQRESTAESIVDRLNDRGFEAVAAVHCGGKDNVQPHCHVAMTSRPVSRDPDEGWIVDRDPSAMFCRGGKDVMRKERQFVCDVVNEELGRELFHPGTLRDTGWGDRVPERKDRAWWRDRKEHEDLDDEQKAALGRQKQRERDEGAERGAEKRAVAIRKKMTDAGFTQLEGGGWQKVENGHSATIVAADKGDTSGAEMRAPTHPKAATVLKLTTSTGSRNSTPYQTLAIALKGAANSLKLYTKRAVLQRGQLENKVSLVKEERDQANAEIEAKDLTIEDLKKTVDKGKLAEGMSETQRVWLREKLIAHNHNFGPLRDDILRQRGEENISMDNLIISKGFAGQIGRLSNDIHQGKAPTLPGLMTTPAPAPVNKAPSKGGPER